MSRQASKPYGDTATTINVHLEPDVVKLLSDYCYSTGITKAQLVTALVKRFLQERELEKHG